jgi:SAM-dependent methyltransferase
VAARAASPWSAPTNVAAPMRPPIEWEHARELNRARWDALAALHGQDAYYDTAALVAGRDSLTAEENDAVAASVGRVGGLDVLHVQCHIGFDSISLARRGARVTGLDFSPACLAKASAIAERCGVELECVQADSTAIGPSLAGRFDLAYATIGVLCWIADVDAWMRSVHATLRPGGRLILIDTHPLQDMVDTPAPLTFDMPYANDGGHRFDGDGSYALPDAKLPAGGSVYYAHSVGEITTAAADAGLHIDALTEHLSCSFEHRTGIPRREDDGWWRLRANGMPLPLLFTLRATKPI